LSAAGEIGSRFKVQSSKLRIEFSVRISFARFFVKIENTNFELLTLNFI